MKKAFVALLASLIAVSAFAGCGGGSGGSSGESLTAETISTDTSEKVHLIMWTSGTASRDHEKVADKLSELAERDLNATLEWNRYPDIQKLNLLLTSGEKIDLIYTANYQNYAVYAAKGAFNPLDELVPAVSPALQ